MQSVITYDRPFLCCHVMLAHSNGFQTCGKHCLCYWQQCDNRSQHMILMGPIPKEPCQKITVNDTTVDLLSIDSGFIIILTLHFAPILTGHHSSIIAVNK